MRVTVLLFAQLREAWGGGTLELDLPDGATVAEAVQEALGRAELSACRELPLRYAVNEHYSDSAASLRENDVLALLTPMAGG